MNDVTTIIQGEDLLCNVPTEEILVLNEHLNLRDAAQRFYDLGLTPLTVVPKQDPHKYPRLLGNGNIDYEADGITPKPKFSGKNPSYFNRSGIPTLTPWKKFLSQQFTQADLAASFPVSLKGVGIGVVVKGDIYCLDFDLKHFPGGSEQLERELGRIFKAYPQLANCFDKTASGGFHVWLKLKQTPSFTRFKLSPDGQHVGELLGNGGFCVCPPTSGYLAISWGDLPEFESIEALDCIFPTKGEKQDSAQLAIESPKPESKASQSADIVAVLAEKASQIWEGNLISDDRSGNFVTLVREILGWDAWMKAQKIIPTRSAESLIDEAIQKLGLEDKADRVLAKLDKQDCKPALWVANKGGNEGDKRCWEKINRSLGKENKKESSDSDSEDDGVQKTFPQIAFEALYKDTHWITVNGVIHQWIGTHYEPIEDAVEMARITRFCDDYRVKIVDKKDSSKVSYSTRHANASSVKNVLEWAKQKTAIATTEIDPPGINLANGVLIVDYVPEEKRFNRNLVAHDPSYYYTYCSDAIYDPNADATDFDRLCLSLDPEHLTIFLRVLASSIALDTVRKYRSRAVRALFLQGDGSNGKDTWKEALAQIFKRGVVSCSFGDFRQYDTGRKFPLAKLYGARVNWASENSGNYSVDNLQALKEAITGENLECEKKGVQGFEFKARCINLFNINDVPDFKGSQSAWKTRIAVVPFGKTFTNKPDAENGELEADSRFKDDPDFIKLNILPAMINRLLDELDNVMSEGIDYTPLDEKLDEIRKVSSHLYEFCQTFEIVEEKGGKVAIKDLWAALESFYLSDGTLDPETRKFNQQTKWNDSTVTSRNQIADRLIKDVFPKAKKARGTGNIAEIRGIVMKSPHTGRVDDPRNQG